MNEWKRYTFFCVSSYGCLPCLAFVSLSFCAVLCCAVLCNWGVGVIFERRGGLGLIESNRSSE